MAKESDYLDEAKAVGSTFDDMSIISDEVWGLVGESGIDEYYGEKIDIGLRAMGLAHQRLAVDLMLNKYEHDRRAAQCADYTVAYRAWQRRYATWQSEMAEYRALSRTGFSPAWPGYAPTEPAKPFPEAEVG